MKTAGYTNPIVGATVTNATVTFDNQGLITSASSGAAPTITTQEEGVTLSSTVNALNFVGAGVTASGAGATTTVTIPDAAASVVLDNTASAPTYPTNPGSLGVWYGQGTKAAAGSVATRTLIGNLAVGASALNTAVGYNANAGSGSGSGTAIGANTVAGNAAVAIGQGVNAANDSVAIGRAFTSSGGNSVAIGYAPSVTALDAIGIGRGATANTANAIALGNGSTTNSVTGAVILCANGTGTVQSAAHAFSLNINASSVNPGSLGISLNNTTCQIPVYATMFTRTAIAGAGLTTTLTATHSKMQCFTGTNTHTVLLPVVTTLANGFEFKISNLSTGAITVNSSGGNLVATLAGATAPAATWGLFVCIDTTGGTGTASWSYEQGF